MRTPSRVVRQAQQVVGVIGAPSYAGPLPGDFSALELLRAAGVSCGWYAQQSPGTRRKALLRGFVAATRWSGGDVLPGEIYAQLDRKDREAMAWCGDQSRGVVARVVTRRSVPSYGGAATVGVGQVASPSSSGGDTLVRPFLARSGQASSPSSSSPPSSTAGLPLALLAIGGLLFFVWAHGEGVREADERLARRRRDRR